MKADDESMYEKRNIRSKVKSVELLCHVRDYTFANKSTKGHSDIGKNLGCLQISLRVLLSAFLRSRAFEMRRKLFLT